MGEDQSGISTSKLVHSSHSEQLQIKSNSSIAVRTLTF